MERKKLIPALVALLAATVVFAMATATAALGGERPSGQAAHTVVIGTEPAYPPYSFLDGNGKPTGYNMELTRALAEVTGLNVEIKMAPWGDIREALEEGRIDAICGMCYSPRRDKRVGFSPPFAVVHHAVFARNGSPGIQSHEELRGKKLIVMLGDIMHDHVLTEGYCEAPILADTRADALKLLASGRGDYALVAKLPGRYWTQKLGLDVGPVGRTLRPCKYGFAIKDGDGELLGRISEGLALLIQSGRHKELSDKWLGSPEHPTASGGTTVRIGVLAKRGKEHCLAKWGLTAEYLTREVPGCSFTISPLTYDEIKRAVRRGEVAFALANPALYVEFEKFHGANRLVTLVNNEVDKRWTLYGGVIFHRADREDIRQLTDLEGKSFMAVHENSFGGWLAAWRELKEHGIDPYRDLSSLGFSGTHDAVVHAVRDGRADAGTVRTGTLEHMAQEGKIRLEDFRVLGHDHAGKETCFYPFKHSTDTYPEWPMVALAHTSDELAEKVAAALLAMPADSSAARAAQCAGWTIPHNYTASHK